MNMASIKYSLLLTALLLAFSCGKDKDPEDDLNPDKDAVVETGITTINSAEAVNKTMTLTLEQKAEVEVRWYPAAANVASSSWETSDKSIVKLDFPRSARYTTVQALKEGQATVTARIKDEDGNVRTAKTLITVVKESAPQTLHFIETIKFDLTNVKVEKPGDSFTINATITPADADYPELIWDISDQSILKAEPSSDGLKCKVTALKSGGAKVYAYSAYSKAYVECNVTVGKSPVTSLRLPEGTNRLKIGNTGTFYVAWEPEDAADINLLWDVDPDYLEVVKQSKNSITVRAVSLGEGNFITVRTQSGSVSASAKVECFTDTVVPVDLGLSVLWGSQNIGASTPYEEGVFFAWGELKTKKKYESATYKWYDRNKGYTKYCFTNVDGVKDGKTRLLPEDDIATRLGGKWRMPTFDEVKELQNAIMSADYSGEMFSTGTDVKGFVVTNKKTGKCVGFPVAGYRSGDAQYNRNLYCYFWSSDLALEAAEHNRRTYEIPVGSAGYAQSYFAEYNPRYSDALRFWPDFSDCMYYQPRTNGLTVRPVCDK